MPAERLDRRLGRRHAAGTLCDAKHRREAGGPPRTDGGGVPIGGGSRRGRAAVVSLLLVPSVGFAILVAWNALDSLLGSLEVSRFIREHRAIVARRLSDPKVHAFSLSHTPGHPATLLIRFDVEDKSTYLRLEEDLSDHLGLRFPAQWQTVLRSEEDLGFDPGIAAQGIGEVMEAAWRIQVAVVASFVVAGAYLFFTGRRPRSRAIPGGEIGGQGSAGRDGSQGGSNPPARRITK